jgi:hypothetical protein
MSERRHWLSRLLEIIGVIVVILFPPLMIFGLSEAAREDHGALLLHIAREAVLATAPMAVAGAILAWYLFDHPNPFISKKKKPPLV